ncbi:MAG: DUF6291 domain-containing protein [Treponema sp.]|jgi:hypothetical protein|nr:DUF6291 domain-containing protein [Treponema sp.]
MENLLFCPMTIQKYMAKKAVEKAGVIILYKYRPMLETLSKEDQADVLMSALRYDETGKNITLKNSTAQMLYSCMKLDIDKMKENWVDTVERNRKNGKKGGRPKKVNPNNPVVSEITGGLFGKPTENSGFFEKPKKPEYDSGNGSESESDLESEFEKENGGGDQIDPPVDFSNSPPPQILEIIISESLRMGFIIDTKKAIEIYKSGIDLSWYEGPHAFMKLAAERARGGRYADLPEDEQKAIYISALLKWDDLRQEYPVWRESQEKNERLEALRFERERIKNTPPKICQCGAELGPELCCPVCERVCYFDDEQWRWVFIESQNIPSLTGGFKAYLKSRKVTQ